MMNFLDEMTEHRLGNLEISDNTILHGPYGHDVSRRASQHPFGFFAYGQDICCARLDCYHGRFPQNNSPVAHVHEGIGRPEVNPNVIGKQALKLR
jgi:hypothetical protein